MNLGEIFLVFTYGYTLQSYLKRHADNWLTILDKRSPTVRFGETDANRDDSSDNMIMTGLGSFAINGQLFSDEALKTSEMKGSI